MGDPVVLPVTFIPQQPGLCGAACAQMLLNARGAAGTSLEEQFALWAEIQSHTQRTRPNPPGNKCTVCGFFDNQICERDVNCAQCWCTHPRALATTLNARLDGASSFAPTRGGEQAVTAMALDTIDRGIPSVMLVYGTRHWVVVHGYTPVEEGGMVLGNHRVSHIHVRDPKWQDAEHGNLAIPVGKWMADYMANVEFGEFRQTCVVVTEEA
jgi:hypothetical protein